MTDVVIFDQLADVKRLAVNEAFLHLEKRFQTERGRHLARMLDANTSPEETVCLKAVVNALEKVSPMALAEAVLRIESKNSKQQNPEMWKVRKA